MQVIRASNAELWFNCPGSLAMEQGKPDEPDESTYEGICAHYLAQKLIDGTQPPEDGKISVVKLASTEGYEASWFAFTKETGELVYTRDIDDAFLRDVKVYISKVEERKAMLGKDAITFVEQDFNFSFMTRDQNDKCTPDFLAYAPKIKTAYIDDLKFGYGEVSAIENKQLLCYAAAFAMHWYKIHHEYPQHYVIRIIQPRLNIVSVWGVTWGELQDFIDAATDAADFAQLSLSHPHTEPAIKQIKPGTHCQNGHCKARASCPQLADYITAEVDAETLPMTHDEFKNELSRDRLKWLYERVRLFRGWADQIEQTVVDGFKKGENPIQGFKLVKKDKGTRIYRDKDETIETLKQMRIPQDVAFPRSMLSAPKLMDACAAGKIGSRNAKRLEEQITRTDPKLIVVPDTDERPAVNATSDDFEVVEDTGAAKEPKGVIESTPGEVDWFGTEEPADTGSESDLFDFI